MIFIQLIQQLKSLNTLISSLTDDQYTREIEHLGNASIGGHTRHIIELLQCSIDGYKNGKVDYFNRQRNMQLQTQKEMAVKTLCTLQQTLNAEDKILKMVIDEDMGQVPPSISTTYFREIVYNTEHAIHHMALIKVALNEMKLDLVEPDFGMAYSTLKYKSTLQMVS